MIMSFLKFAILSTLGECIGLRISAGVYNRKGFGVLPRAIVWGILGMGISMAMTIFANGVPAFLKSMGMENATTVMGESLSWSKVFVAFCISVGMNTIFAPVFMTLHKITDTHILSHGGTLAGFLTPIQMGEIMANLNWRVQWNFVQENDTVFLVSGSHDNFPVAGRRACFVCRVVGCRFGNFVGGCHS